MVALLPDIWSADMSSNEIRSADCYGGRSCEESHLLAGDAVTSRTKEEEKEERRQSWKEAGKVDRQQRRRRKKDKKLLRNGPNKNVTFAEPLVITSHEYPAAVYEKDEADVLLSVSELSSATPRCGKGMSGEGMALRTGHLTDPDEDEEGLEADPTVAILPIPSRRAVPSMVADEWEKEVGEAEEEGAEDSLTESESNVTDEDQGSVFAESEEAADDDEQQKHADTDARQPTAPPVISQLRGSSCAQSALPYINISIVPADSLPNENDQFPSRALSIEANAPRHSREQHMTFATAIGGDEQPLLPMESRIRSFNCLLKPPGTARHPRCCSPQLARCSSGPKSACLYVEDEPLHTTACHETTCHVEEEEEEDDERHGTFFSSDVLNMKKEELPIINFSSSSLILNEEEESSFRGLLLNGDLNEGDTNTSKASLTTLASSPSNTPIPAPQFRLYPYAANQSSDFSSVETSSTTTKATWPLSTTSRTCSERSEPSDFISDHSGSDQDVRDHINDTPSFLCI
eukprot:GHVS01049241.1.p1 GENE.GHVS01049241.1~~GHVS01049241.1.p1  ORF type:complete len:518 (+),score=104.96 GHVS01049241.1:128-1681(+)